MRCQMHVSLTPDQLESEDLLTSRLSPKTAERFWGRFGLVGIIRARLSRPIRFRLGDMELSEFMARSIMDDELPNQSPGCVKSFALRPGKMVAE